MPFKFPWPKFTAWYHGENVRVDPLARRFAVAGDVQFDLRYDMVKDLGESFVLAFTEGLALQIRDLARHNVRPGGGPGPHPHKPEVVAAFGDWEDTGALWDSIKVDTIAHRTGYVAVSVTSEMPVRPDKSVAYNVHLELGWLWPSGYVGKYPYLQPAMEQATSVAMEYAVRTFDMIYARQVTGPRYVPAEGFLGELGMT